MDGWGEGVARCGGVPRGGRDRGCVTDRWGQPGHGQPKGWGGELGVHQEGGGRPLFTAHKVPGSLLPEGEGAFASLGSLWPGPPFGSHHGPESQTLSKRAVSHVSIGGPPGGIFPAPNSWTTSSSSPTACGFKQPKPTHPLPGEGPAGNHFFVKISSTFCREIFRGLARRRPKARKATEDHPSRDVFLLAEHIFGSLRTQHQNFPGKRKKKCAQ